MTACVACGRDAPSGSRICDDCRARIPENITTVPHWRRTYAQAVMGKDWGTVDLIDRALEAWLQVYPGGKP